MVKTSTPLSLTTLVKLSVVETDQKDITETEY